MKLNNTFPEIDLLIQKMKATEIKWRSSGRLTNLQLQKLSSIEGLERTLEDIEMDEHQVASNAMAVINNLKGKFPNGDKVIDTLQWALL